VPKTPLSEWFALFTNMLLRITSAVLVLASLATAQTLSLVSGNGQLIKYGSGQGSEPIVFAVMNGSTPMSGQTITFTNSDGSRATSMIPEMATTGADGTISVSFYPAYINGDPYLQFSLQAHYGSQVVPFFETSANIPTVNFTLIAPSPSLLEPLTAQAYQPAGTQIAVNVISLVAGNSAQIPNIALRIIPTVTGTPPPGTNLQLATCLEAGSNPEGKVFTDSSGVAVCTPIFALPNASLNPAYNPATFKVEIGDENSFGPFPYNISPAALSMNGPVGVFLTEGEASTLQVTGSGGVQPYTFSLAPTSGLLPGGLKLQPNGQIVGASNTPGVFPFTVILTDATGTTLTSPAFGIVISEGGFNYTPQILPAAVTGMPYAQTVAVSGGVPPYTFALVGALPAGIGGAVSPSGTSVKISGLPTAAGPAAFGIKVTDAIGEQAIAPFPNFLVVPQLVVSNVSPQVATVSTPFTFQVPINGGIPPYTVTTSPALPTGLTITSTGLITGTPTGAPGIYAITISVTDTLGLTGSTIFTLGLSAGSLGLGTSPTFPAEQAGVAFSVPVPVTGGIPPYTYAINSSPGQTLSISPAGILSGTIILAGSDMVTFSVADSSGKAATLAITIPVSPAFAANGVGNAASYDSSSVAPGEIVSIFGSGLGPIAGEGATLSSSGTVSTSDSGSQVLFGTYAAPILYASATQLNVVVPFEVTPGADVAITVTSNGQTSSPVSVPVTQAVPGIFLIGNTQAAVLNDVNQALSENGPSNPAVAGGVIVIYATGGGMLSSPVADGEIPTTLINVENTTLTIGGQPAIIDFAGLAPGFVGVLQINATLPNGIAAGSAVPLVLSIGDGSSSTQTATIAIQ
jgi:uncharacterized protein (TIGR03437 family)